MELAAFLFMYFTPTILALF